MKRKQERMREVEVTRRVTQVERTCPVCSRSFWGAPISRYCSRLCRVRANYARHAEEYRRKRVEKYHKQKEQP